MTGIGPRIALNVLSGMSPSAFRSAVAAGDLRALSQVSGVGRKTAERIVVELKDRIGSVGALEMAGGAAGVGTAEQSIHDAVLALVALGFKQSEAFETVRSAQAALGPQATVEQLVRAGLKKGGG